MELMYEGEWVTLTRRYPAYSMFWTQNGEFKVHEYQDHLEVWRADSRGRWRRRKTLPRELAKYFSVLDKYEVEVKPAPTDQDWKYQDWVAPLPSGWQGMDAGSVRDPAFMERELNPLVEVRTEDGRIIWSQWRDSFRRWLGLPVVPVPASLTPDES